MRSLKELNKKINYIAKTHTALFFHQVTLKSINQFSDLTVFSGTIRQCSSSSFLGHVCKKKGNNLNIFKMLAILGLWVNEIVVILFFFFLRTNGK